MHIYIFSKTVRLDIFITLPVKVRPNQNKHQNPIADISSSTCPCGPAWSQPSSKTQ